MEENLVQEMKVQSQEPTFVDNSLIEPEITTSKEANQIQDCGQSYSEDPSNELILGKFKKCQWAYKSLHGATAFSRWKLKRTWRT